MTERLSVTNRIQAELWEFGDGLVYRSARLRRPFRPADTPSTLAVHWQHARRPAVEALGSWFTFGGHAASGRTASGYKEAVIYTMNRDFVDGLSLAENARHGVAFILGKSAVMFGTTEESQFYGVNPEDPEQYAVAAGIGKGVLRGTPVLIHGEREIISLHRHAEASEPLPRAEIPAWVPLP